MKTKKILLIWGLVLSYILLTISFVTFVLLIFPVFTENPSISQYIFSSEKEQNIWNIISFISIVIFSIISIKLRDLNWNTGKGSITKMLDETFSSHFKFATRKTKNYKFSDVLVLDYLLSAIRSITTENELVIFEYCWMEIESVIERLSDDFQNDLLPEMKAINNHIDALKNHHELYDRQKGIEDFYENEYQKLYNESLKMKELIKV